MKSFELYNDDCLNALKTMEENSIDSCVTDPPYGLSFMGKLWDYDVPKAEIWKEVFRVLKPGGHLLAFFGSRTYHRGVVQIEDAGFEIRDQIMWLYGTGFPKSHDVSKAIDKAAGVERTEVIGKSNRQIGPSMNGENGVGTFKEKNWQESNLIYAPVTEEAKQWQGWGTALKPAHEPIVVARKPLIGTVAETVLAHGTGALNIDDCRIDGKPRTTHSHGNVRSKPGSIYGGGNGLPTGEYSGAECRWPANVIHDGSDEVLAGFPHTKSGARKAGTFRGSADSESIGNFGNFESREIEASEGSAARFFYSAKASPSDRNEGLDVFKSKKPAAAEFRPNYMEKAEQGEDGNPYGRWNERKNIHPTVKPTDLMRYLCRLVTPKKGIVLDPFMGSGSTGKAAAQEDFRFVGIEMSKDYFEIAEARIKHAYDNQKKGLSEFFD